MNREDKQLYKKNIFYWSIFIFVITIGIFVLISFWPIRSFLLEGYWKGKTLVVITNENEARPCGGFATAYGVVQIFPPRIEFQDAYTLKTENLGEAGFPLTKVAQNIQFWDVGTTSDMSECADIFKETYEKITHKPVSNILFIDFQSIKQIFNIFKNIQIDGKKIEENTFFGTISRSVANVDRHNEKDLESRKSPMKQLWNQAFIEVLKNPFHIAHITKIIQENTEKGNIYGPGISPKRAISYSDFGVTEWNLGGGKSSRYIQKYFFITAREKKPKEWDIQVQLRVSNRGQPDEPIGQDWKGVFEIQFPEFLQKKSQFLETHIPLNGSFEKEWFFVYKGILPHFGIFVPRGQDLYADVSWSLFPQKILQNANFETRENIGIFFQKIEEPKKFMWTEKDDKISPFITLHTIVAPNTIEDISIPEQKQLKFEESDMIVEVHFNEEVFLKNDFEATIQDTDWENSYTEDPDVHTFLLLSDKKTLLIGAKQNKKQISERFSLLLEKVEDVFGNEITPAERTIIDRIKKRENE